MEQEDNKEIEWLVGSIKRSVDKLELVILGIAGLLFVVAGVVVHLFEWAPDSNYSTFVKGIWTGSIFVIASILGLIRCKHIQRANNAQELLSTIDKFNKWEWIIISIVICIWILFFIFTGFNFDDLFMALISVGGFLFEQRGKKEDEDIDNLRAFMAGVRRL